MQLNEFTIGERFSCGDNKYMCTDVGTRVAVGIRLDGVNAIITNINGRIERIRLNKEEAEKGGWFNGPPFPVVEMVFDEEDILGCTKAL